MWSYCRLLHQAGISVQCTSLLFSLCLFLHTPALNILLWKNPLRRYRPLPLHMLKISSQDHLYNPPHPLLACFSFCPPSPHLLDSCPSRLFTSRACQFITLHNPQLFYRCFSSLTPFPAPTLSPHRLPPSPHPSPPRPLGISADIGGQSSLHPSIRPSMEAAKRSVDRPADHPARPAGQMESGPAIGVWPVGGEARGTDEFLGHANTGETGVGFS